MERENKREILAVLRMSTSEDNNYVGNLHFQTLIVPESKGFKNLVRILR